MSDKPDKLQWHPAFYAAAELELQEDLEGLSFEREYNLSKEPIKIDLLIIKNTKEKKLKNEIGHIMRTYNIIEYKSPGDGLSIDDLFKTIGYACLYKGYGKTVNEIPAEEITISLFREKYPKELFLTLKSTGYKITERTAGIYDITGNLPFPLQVIVTRLLAPEHHSSLRILSKHAKKADIKQFLMETEHYTTPGEKNNISALLQVSAKANYKLYGEIRRESEMNDVLRELMKEDIEEMKEKGLAEGRVEGRAEGRVEGRAEGSNIRLINQINKKIKKGQTPDVIADMLEEDLSHVKIIYDIIKESDSDFDAAEIYKKLTAIQSA